LNGRGASSVWLHCGGAGDGSGDGGRSGEAVSEGDAAAVLRGADFHAAAAALLVPWALWVRRQDALRGFLSSHSSREGLRDSALGFCFFSSTAVLVRWERGPLRLSPLRVIPFLPRARRFTCFLPLGSLSKGALSPPPGLPFDFRCAPRRRVAFGALPWDDFHPACVGELLVLNFRVIRRAGDWELHFGRVSEAVAWW
jgi:hypothetical protein